MEKSSSVAAVIPLAKASPIWLQVESSKELLQKVLQALTCAIRDSLALKPHFPITTSLYLYFADLG